MNRMWVIVLDGEGPGKGSGGRKSLMSNAGWEVESIRCSVRGPSLSPLLTIVCGYHSHINRHRYHPWQVYINVDMYIYICVYIYICIHIYISIYIYMFMYIYLSLYMCNYFQMWIHVCAYKYISIHQHIIYIYVIGTDLQNIPMSNNDNETRPISAPHPDSLTLVIPDTPYNSPVKVGNKSDSFSAENYRIFFHMITQDHQLPDLIWNERTRSGPFVLICVATYIFVSMYLCFCFCLFLFLVSLHFNSYSLSLTVLNLTPLILLPFP
jgi:nuclear pore complex protein Nup62